MKQFRVLKVMSFLAVMVILITGLYSFNSRADVLGTQQKNCFVRAQYPYSLLGLPEKVCFSSIEFSALSFIAKNQVRVEIKGEPVSGIFEFNILSQSESEVNLKGIIFQESYGGNFCSQWIRVVLYLNLKIRMIDAKISVIEINPVGQRRNMYDPCHDIGDGQRDQILFFREKLI